MECSAWSPQKALSALLDCRLATAAADLSFPARAGPVETAAASPLHRLRSVARLLLGAAAPEASRPSARPRAGARVRRKLRARRAPLAEVPSAELRQVSTAALRRQAESGAPSLLPA